MPTEIKIALKKVGCRVRITDREREREGGGSFIKRGCHMLRLYSIGDRCMGLDRGGNDTDRGTSKYEYRTRSQTLPTKNPTRNDLRIKSGLLGDKKVTS